MPHPQEQLIIAQQQAEAAGGGGGGGGAAPVPAEQLRGQNPLLLLLRTMLPWVNAGACACRMHTYTRVAGAVHSGAARSRPFSHGRAARAGKACRGTAAPMIPRDKARACLPGSYRRGS